MRWILPCAGALGMTALANPATALLAPASWGLRSSLVLACLVVLDVWLLASAGYCLRQRGALRWGGLAGFQGRCLGILLLLELGLHGVNALTGFIPAWEPPNSGKILAKVQLEEYRDEPWAERFWRENSERIRRGLDWHPHLGLVFGEYDGEYINYRDGLRKTWQPRTLDPAEAEHLYVFGGSTTFCWGARDEYTMPSHLGRELWRRGNRVIVRNAGEITYGVGQELHKLVLLLRDGRRIDHVVFYDGANEVGAFVEGEPGRIQGHGALQEAVDNAKRLTYELSPSQAGLAMVALGGGMLVRDNLFSVVALSRLFEPLGLAPVAERNTSVEEYARHGPRDASAAEIQGFAEGIADHYVRTLRVLDHLSRAYGFSYVTFWQPMFPLEEHRFPEEIAGARAHYPYYLDPTFEQLYERATRQVAQADLPHHHDITHVLADRPAPFYYDGPHLTEEGNAYLAERMAPYVERELLGGGEPPVEGGSEAGRTRPPDRG